MVVWMWEWKSSVLLVMIVTWETTHFERSWLNLAASENAAREEKEEKGESKKTMKYGELAEKKEEKKKKYGRVNVRVEVKRTACHDSDLGDIPFGNVSVECALAAK